MGLSMGSLQEALSRCTFRLPAWRVRDIVDRMDRPASQTPLTLEEFMRICEDLKSREVSATFKRSLTKRPDVQALGGMSAASS